MLEEAYNIPGIFLAAIISTLATFFFRRRYHHVVFLQVLLLPVALIEPSPSDIIFAFILLYSFSLGVIDLVKIKGQGIPILLLSGFLVINGISFCNVTDYSQGLKFIMITIYLFLYAIFIFLYACPKKIFSLLKGYVLGASSAAVMGIMGYCGIFPALFMFDPFRAKALFKGPNVFGPFLVPAIVILIADLLDRNLFQRRTHLYLLLLLLNLVGLTLSFSRGAWANLLLALTVYWFLNCRRINYRKLAFWILAFILLFSISWKYLLEENFKEFILNRSKIQGYDLKRFSVQLEGLELLAENPLGYGPGQYEVAVQGETGRQHSSHSLYVRLLLENGLLGFVFFLAAILYILHQALARTKEAEDYSVNSAIFVVLLGVLVSSFAVDTLHWRHLWLFIGLALAAGCNQGKTAEQIDYDKGDRLADSTSGFSQGP